MRVGLTGGIGTGKSSVSKRLSALGLPVLDADAISRKQLEIDGGCYNSAVQLFGKGILNAAGSINRKSVADIVFHDKAMLEALNALIHPAVWNQMDAAAKILEAEDSEVPVVFDVPLLIESGWHKEMDITILVTCPQDLVIKRVMQRDGASREEVLARMQAQMNQDEKLKFADIVIDNSGTYEALLDQVDRLYQKLLNLAKRG